MTSTAQRISNEPPQARLGTALLLGAATLLALAGFARAEEVTISHGISSFGDLKYPADFRHFDFVNPDAPQGGTFTSRGTGASSTFDSLNPFILKGEPAQGLGALYDTLLTGSPDEADASYGYIAETLEYPADRQWVIFNMRPEARFQDGVPITAEDVVWSFNTLIEKGQPVYGIIYKDFEKVEALDTHRVKFTFKPGVNTRDLPSAAGGVPILPRHYYDTRDFTESSLDIPLGSGAYTVRDMSPGKFIEYCKIPDYWGAKLPSNVGAGNFECIRFEYFSDHTAAFEALKAGVYTFHEEFFSKIWATGYDFPAVEKGWVIKEAIPDGRPSGTQGFWINLRQEKFADPRVRQALGLLFNFEWSNQTLFYGLYTRTDSFWENSDMQAKGLPEGEELALLEEFRDLLPPEVFTEPAFSPAENEPVASDRKAIRAASRLLEAAGWTVNDSGMRVDAEGKTLKVEVVDDSPSFERIINPYIENLRRAGIDATYALIDPAQMQERQKNFDFDLIPGRLVMSLTPGDELLSTFGTAGANTPNSSNFSGVADPAVDAIISKIAAAQTRDDMAVAVRALDRVLRAKHIWVPNWFKASHNIAYWDMFGKPTEKPPFSRGTEYWWFDQAKYDRLKAAGAPVN